MAAHQHPHAGFIHNGLIVYALQYALATEPASWLIVWLDELGNSLHPYVRASEPNRRIVTVKPGETHPAQGIRVPGCCSHGLSGTGRGAGAGSGGVKEGRRDAAPGSHVRVRSQAIGEFGVGVGSARNRRFAASGWLHARTAAIQTCLSGGVRTGTRQKRRLLASAQQRADMALTENEDVPKDWHSDRCRYRPRLCRVHGRAPGRPKVPRFAQPGLRHVSMAGVRARRSDCDDAWTTRFVKTCGSRPDESASFFAGEDGARRPVIRGQWQGEEH